MTIQASASPQPQQDPGIEYQLDANNAGEQNEAALTGQDDANVGGGTSGGHGKEADTGSHRGIGQSPADEGSTTSKPTLIANAMLRVGAAQFIARGGMMTSFAATVSRTSQREPYLYTGLHTAPEQGPHYAASLTYGRERGSATTKR